jgi:hypothetical protein
MPKAHGPRDRRREADNSCSWAFQAAWVDDPTPQIRRALMLIFVLLSRAYGEDHAPRCAMPKVVTITTRDFTFGRRLIRTANRGPQEHQLYGCSIYC